MERKVKDITIVSLSRGILGEPFIKHEIAIGISRLESYGIKVNLSRHALAGLQFIEQHPEKRAEDLLTALKSDTDMILGGCIDTIFDMLDGNRFSDSPDLCKRYALFPALSDF